MPKASFALVSALLLAAGPVPAEIIALGVNRPPFCLVAESVRIGVGRHMAFLEGDYDYKYVARYDSTEMADGVSFQYMVAAPKTADSLDELIAATQAKLHLGSLDLEPEDFLVPGESVDAATKAAQMDTRPVILIFRIPRRLLHQQCRLHVSHYQLHDRYAGKTVMTLLPLLPDFEPLKNELLFSQSDFTIELDVVDAVQLRRLSANRYVDRETPQRLILHPVDHESILVEVTGAAGK